MSTASAKTALITGASQGIGEAVARKLAALGFDLMLASRNLVKLDALANELTGQFPDRQVLVCPCDVSQAPQVERAAAMALGAFGRLDVLINNAGVAPRSCLLQELSVEDIDRTIDTNLKGAIYAMRAVIPAMSAQGSGTIININSSAGKTAFPYWSVYDASKFGLRAMTEAVAEEQRGNGIKVIGLYPGATDTAIWGDVALEAELRKEGMLQPEQIADAVAYVLAQPPHVFIPEITLTPLQPVL